MRKCTKCGEEKPRGEFSKDGPGKKAACRSRREMSYNEGDIDSQERGTCARSNGGKVEFSLIPFHLLTGTARVLMDGAKKYAPWNWAKGGKWSTPMDCMLRHLFKWWYCGEENDPESGEHHLDHVMCNLLFLMHYKDTYDIGDNRPGIDLTCFNEALSALSTKEAK